MATSTLGSGTLVLAGTTSGTTTVTATAVAGTTTLTLPAATDTLVGKATTDTLTNKTLTGAAMNGTLGATTASTANVTTLTTSSTVTHNGGTINGVAFLDGSKVLTTGSVLTFDGVTLSNSTSGTPLSLNRTGAATALIELKQSGTVGGYIGTTGANNFTVYNASASALITLNNTGLGIGNTSPTQKLDVNGVVTTTPGLGSSGAFALGYGSNAASRSWRMRIDDAAFGDFSIQQTTTQTGSTYSTKLTIDPSGNLLVGTTSAGVTDTSSITLERTSAFSYYVVNHVTGSASGDKYAYFGYAGSTIGSITQSGTTAVLYNVTSDQRLKENIQDAESASVLIGSLKVRQFDWKADNSHQRYGFVAQELVAVAPEAVHQPTDTKEMMAVDYSKLVPMLIKAHQEQQAIITQLTARITALEGA